MAGYLWAEGEAPGSRWGFGWHRPPLRGAADGIDPADRMMTRLLLAERCVGSGLAGIVPFRSPFRDWHPRASLYIPIKFTSSRFGSHRERPCRGPACQLMEE